MLVAPGAAAQATAPRRHKVGCPARMLCEFNCADLQHHLGGAWTRANTISHEVKSLLIWPPKTAARRAAFLNENFIHLVALKLSIIRVTAKPDNLRRTLRTVGIKLVAHE